jgi:hypothetical protein
VVSGCANAGETKLPRETALTFEVGSPADASCKFKEGDATGFDRPTRRKQPAAVTRQTPDKVRNRMRLLATQREHLHSDFSNVRLMDEICPIVYFLHGKDRSALQNSRFAKLALPAGFRLAPTPA